MWNRKKKCKINPETGKRIYRKKSPLKKLEDKADDLTKAIIRLRDGWKCQKCNKTITNPSDAHRAHIVSSNHKMLRWDLLNLLLVCMACHRQFHDAVAIKWWVCEEWSARYTYLFEEGGVPRCNQTSPHRTPVEKVAWMKQIIAELEAKLKELKGGRKNTHG